MFSHLARFADSSDRERSTRTVLAALLERRSTSERNGKKSDGSHRSCHRLPFRALPAICATFRDRSSSHARHQLRTRGRDRQKTLYLNAVCEPVMDHGLHVAEPVQVRGTSSQPQYECGETLGGQRGLFR